MMEERVIAVETDIPSLIAIPIGSNYFATRKGSMKGMSDSEFDK